MAQSAEMFLSLLRLMLLLSFPAAVAGSTSREAKLVWIRSRSLTLGPLGVPMLEIPGPVEASIISNVMVPYS